MIRAALLLVVLVLSASAQGQHVRVYLNGLPTNMRADWGQVVTAPLTASPPSFLALMPLSSVSTWAYWDADAMMDITFGPGNWLRVHMQTDLWAYLSPDACAHQPAPGGAAPQSLLTSTFDYGAYSGISGSPLFAGATAFQGGYSSFVQGLPAWGSFNAESWQLRTRGWLQTDLWNACPGASLTPTFSGYLGARFTVTIS